MPGDWISEMLDEAFSLASKLNDSERVLLLDTCVEAALINKAATKFACLKALPANQPNRPSSEGAMILGADENARNRAAAAKRAL